MNITVARYFHSYRSNEATQNSEIKNHQRFFRGIHRNTMPRYLREYQQFFGIAGRSLVNKCYRPNKAVQCLFRSMHRDSNKWNLTNLPQSSIYSSSNSQLVFTEQNISGAITSSHLFTF